MIRAKVGTRIRQIRKAKKISQEALANICELDRTYITSVECGIRNISFINLEKITDALGVSLQEFFSFTNEK